MVASDCARAYRSNSILTATPGQLVLMLYDGALNAMAMAHAAFDRPSTDLKRYEVINHQIRKARRIIAELQNTLNFEAGEEFAGLMHRLYDYYNRRLNEANIKKDVQPLIEVENLLNEVRDAWAEMLRKRPNAGSAAVPPAPVVPPARVAAAR